MVEQVFNPTPKVRNVNGLKPSIYHFW